MIDFNYYKVFYYVAKLGNFSLAAKELGVSQPAISYTISELEKSISTTLFIRRGKKIELTKTGKDLLEYVEDSFNTLKMAEQNLFHKSTSENYRLTFGIQSYLINALGSLKEQLKLNHNVNFKVLDDNVDNLIEKVENKELEFAIIAGNYFGRLTCKKITDLNMVFVSNKNGILNKDTINKYNFALPLKTTRMRKILENNLSNEGIQINPLYEFNSNHVCLSLMDKIDAVFYIPKELVSKKIDNGNFFVMKTDFKLPSFPINIIYNDKFISREAKKFIENLTNV